MTNLTVIMSVLNGEDYLGEAVSSILNQEYDSFQFLIVNNASTDKTAAILEGFAAKDNRIQILTNEETVPLVVARERAIALAESPWVALMDADDIAEPKRLARQMEVIELEGDTIGALGTFAHQINDRGDRVGVVRTGPTSRLQFEKAMAKNETVILLDPSTVIHRSTFLAVGGYRSEYTPASDLDLWYRIAETGREIRALPEYLMRYRVHSGSLSVSQTMLQRARCHFINHNMRRRRQGLPERTLEEFEAWARPRYRLRLSWYINDLGMSYFKRAGLARCRGDHMALVGNLCLALILKPSMLWNRLLPHVREGRTSG